MYTRCPECRTPYRVTREQLAARDGLVRCGSCQAVFTATEHLLWFAPATDESPPAAAAKLKTRTTPRRRRYVTATDANDPAIPTITALTRRRRTPKAVWIAGSVLLLAALVAQIFYFYGNELARYEAVRPLLTRYCELAGCVLAPARTWTAPELTASTMAPHPRFANALRLRAVLVNRAARAQEPPVLQLTLTDSSGHALARRRFAPLDYLEPPTNAPLSPNIATRALLDVTNPDGKAVGYEIVLLPPTEILSNR